MLRSEKVYFVCFLKIKTEIDIPLLYIQSGCMQYFSHVFVRSEQKSNITIPEVFSSKGPSVFSSRKSYTCIKMFSFTLR